MDLSDKDLLNYALENGMINLDTIRTNIEMNERKKLLEKHTFSIWEGADKKWRTYLPADDGRKMVKRSTKEAVEDAIVDFWKEKEENPSLRQVFKDYIDNRLNNKQISASSHLRYQQDFDRFYSSIKNQKIKTMTAESLCDYIEKRVAELNMTNRAFSNVKAITKGMFKRAYRKKMIEFRIEEEVLQAIDLSDRSFKKNRKEDYEEVFTENEFVEYVKYLSDNPDIWNIGLLLSLVAGLRGGEVVSLCAADLEDKGDFFIINVKRTETRYKNGKDYVYEVKDAPKTEAGSRQAVVPRQYYWIYEKLIANKNDNGFIFCNPENGKRFTTNSLRGRQERNCKKLKIYHKSPHKNRKTYGSILLDNHIDENMIMQQMGHTKISTTERFYHRNMKEYDKKADIISNIDIFSVQK